MPYLTRFVLSNSTSQYFMDSRIQVVLRVGHPFKRYSGTSAQQNYDNFTPFLLLYSMIQHSPFSTLPSPSFKYSIPLAGRRRRPFLRPLAHFVVKQKNERKGKNFPYPPFFEKLITLATFNQL